MAESRNIRMFLIPCSCGTCFSVAEDWDRGGTGLTRYLTCPNCGKRHDPKNRVLELCYYKEGYWKTESC